MMMIEYPIQTLCVTICIQSVCSQLSTVNQQRHHPRPHLNQQTQCHTKDSGFYLYFFICYSQSQQQERNSVEWEAEESKTKTFHFC